nr:hypothetical protein [Tanacetum cinerariifolium]
MGFNFFSIVTRNEEQRKRGDGVANFKRRLQDFHIDGVTDSATALEGDENPICTLGDYSKPSHEGYRNTIELHEGTMWCLFDPTPSVDSLGLNGENRKRTRLCLFQFPLRDQASNWLEHLLARSISTWEANYRSVGRCKLRDRNIEESWALLEDLALYDNESWSDLRDFAKLVKAVSLPQDVLRLVSNFMASQDARLSMFEVDFNQQQGKITKKIDTVLKAITDQITGALPSDTVKNPKLNLNFTAPVLSARSYPMGDPQCSSHPLNSINTVKTCSKETNHSQKDQLPIVTDIRARQTEEPEQTLEDEFKDLHLNLPVLKFLAHALILGDSKPFDTLADFRSCVNIIPLYLFKKLKIGLLEETDHVFGLADATKSYPVGIVRDVEVHIGRLKLLNDFYVKEYQEKDKIGSKPDKNGKRGEAGKCLKQLYLKEEEKPKKTKK